MMMISARYAVSAAMLPMSNDEFAEILTAIERLLIIVFESHVTC